MNELIFELLLFFVCIAGMVLVRLYFLLNEIFEFILASDRLLFKDGAKL